MVSFLYLRLQRSCVPLLFRILSDFPFSVTKLHSIQIWEAEASNSFKTFVLLSTTESETDVGVNGDRAMCLIPRVAAVHIQAVDHTHLITIVLVGLACFAKLC